MLSCVTSLLHEGSDCRLQELTKLESLILYPHLDLPAWEQWRAHLTTLHECILRVLKSMESQSSAACARLANARTQKQSFFNHCDQQAMITSGVDFRDATSAVHMKYIEVDKALKCCQAYYPLSLSLFEPTNYSERFRWLRDFALSYPIALLKFSV